jgi:hypothetical protein
MGFLAALLGVVGIMVIFADVFETIVLPRTVMRRARLSSVFFDLASNLYGSIGRRKPTEFRSRLLVAFAPMSLLTLLVIWAILMILAWALVVWGFQLGVSSGPPTLGEALYYSGTTFLTLGYGDMVPTEGLGRTLAIVEAGTGFGYIALVIGYVPVLYSAFSRRERQMLLLDSKAGSQPTGVELLLRFSRANAMPRLAELLKDWEGFSAECLESYLSYPIIAYYRSQHDQESWLKSLTAVLDACALIEVSIPVQAPWWDELHFQARSTFAMARHLIVDLAYILDVPPRRPDGRLTPAQSVDLRQTLNQNGFELQSLERLDQIRSIYEPYVLSLAEELVLDLPSWYPPSTLDNWQTSAWEDPKHF